MIDEFYDPPVLTEDQKELLKFYHDCTTCHAYDENGKLYGEIILKITYSGFANDIEVLSTDITKEPFDPGDYY